jgi:hypothetical protein
MMSDNDADSEATDLVLCLIKKKKCRWIKEWYKRTSQYTHENFMTDKTEGAKRLKILSAIRRSII